MSFNLLRNARVFYTSNVNSTTGVVQASGFTTSNTFELQVLDGLSYSQGTTSDVITLMEAGASPTRGQRSFNTALNPVDFSFSTYVRPYKHSTTAVPNIECEEKVLWNALAAPKANTVIGGTSSAWTGGTASSALSFANSNAHQLHAFGLIIILDNTAYFIDNAALGQATIDFGLDSISTIAWTGQGTALRDAGSYITCGSATNTAVPGQTQVNFSGAISGTASGKNTNAKFLANKLSEVTMKVGIGTSGAARNIALTGGSITFNNNLTFLTPANLGTVNSPVTYFTGTRAISGTMNCYLRLGATNSAGLLSEILTNASTDVDPEYYLKFSIGGASASNRVDIEMNGVVLQVPSVNTDKVISAAINFTAQGTTASAFDLTATNEATVTYYAA